MPEKSKIYEELDWLSERISARVWVISIAVLATSFAYLVESTKADGAPFLNPKQVFWPAILALTSILFDILQYISAFFLTRSLLRNIEDSEKDALPYNKSDFLYRARSWSFYLKMVLCVLSAVWIIVLSVERALSLS